MKRSFVFLLTLVMFLSCVSCSSVKNPPERNFQGNEINNDKSPTSMASEEMDETEIAQQAYNLINRAEFLCTSGMRVVSAAWHFGIWDAPECDTDSVMERLSAQIGFDLSFVVENAGYTADELINGDGNFDGWEFCLMSAENCLSAVGTYTSANETLDTAKDLIRKLSDDYANLQYLKDYYTKVAAYVSFFENVYGSYNDLVETITEHESKIQTAKEPLLFDFG